MAPLLAPAEKPSQRVSDSQSHAKVRPPAQVAVFCAALRLNLQPALTPPPHRSRSHLVLDPLRLPSSLQFSLPPSSNSHPHLHPLLTSHLHPIHSPPPSTSLPSSLHFSPPTSIQFSPHPPSNSHLILHPIHSPPPSTSHPSPIHFSPLTHPLLTPHPSTSHPLKFPFLNLNNLQTNAPPGRAESRSLENRRNPGVLGRRNTCRPSREKRHGGGVALC